MFQPLPSSIDLVKRAWGIYTKKWNEFISLSAWFIYFGIVNFALAIFTHFVPVGGAFIAIPLQIVMALLSIWAVIRIMQASLNAVDDKDILLSPEDGAKTWNFFWPLLLTGLIQFFIILGGMVLLIIPGLYLALALAYSSLHVVDRKMKGMEAIKASFRLVKGRWWSVWWRETATGVIVGLCVLIVVGLVEAIVSMLALGPSGLTSSLADPSNTNTMYQATMDLFTSIAEAATMPLFIILRTVIYRNLQKTQSE
jgi:hypothetical protein